MTNQKTGGKVQTRTNICSRSFTLVLSETTKLSVSADECVEEGEKRMLI